MVRHHPSSSMLLAYAAGAQSWSMSISVAAHLQMCTLCRQKACDLNDIGGALLESVPEEKPSPDAFRRLMGKIEQRSGNPPYRPVRVHGKTPDSEKAPGPASKKQNADIRCSEDLFAAPLPHVLRRLLPPDGRLIWKRVTPSLRLAPIDIGQEANDMAFYHMAAGGKVASHGHRGLEITLVLSGNFSDATGLYSPGDFVVKDEGDTHRPTATQDQACVYLSVAQAPRVHRSWHRWLRNPFSP